MEKIKGKQWEREIDGEWNRERRRGKREEERGKEIDIKSQRLEEQERGAEKRKI